jgi:hypothetical protein
MPDLALHALLAAVRDAVIVLERSARLDLSPATLRYLQQDIAGILHRLQTIADTAWSSTPAVDRRIYDRRAGDRPRIDSKKPSDP